LLRKVSILGLVTILAVSLWRLSHVPKTYSTKALRLRREVTTTPVFVLRDSAFVMEVALLHALITRKPTVFVHPPWLRKYDLHAIKKQYPFITWIESPHDNKITAETVEAVRRLRAGGRIDLNISELSLAFALERPLEGSQIAELLRLSDEVSVFEEGLNTYLTVLPSIVSWRKKERQPLSELRARMSTHYRAYLAGSVQPNFFGMLILPHFTFYLSRPDITSPMLPFTPQLLDLDEAWQLLAEADREFLHWFFRSNLEEIKQWKKQSPKPDMLVVGSVGENRGHTERCEQWLDYVFQKNYGQYDLFFKPHPRDGHYASYLEQRYPGKFKVLSQWTPAELFHLSGVEFDSYSFMGISSVLLHVDVSQVDHIYDFYLDVPELMPSFLALNLIPPGKIFSAVPTR